MSKPTICTRVRHLRRRVREAVVPSVVGLTVGVAMGAATTSPSDAATESATHVRQYPACAQEDGQLCVWRNHGPGYSFVAGKDRDPSVREQIAHFRVSDRIADTLIRRDNWRPVPDRLLGVRMDLVHPTRDGRTTVRATERSSMSIGDTTYVITGRLVAGS